MYLHFCSIFTPFKPIAVKKFLKQTVLFLCCILFFTFCTNQPKATEEKETENNSATKATESFVPDTIINGKFSLRTPGLLEELKLILFVKLIEKIRQSPVAIISNEDQSEYLLLHQFEGDTEDTYSILEISKEEPALKNAIQYHSGEQNFQSESGVKLGLSMADIVKIKGSGYTLEVEGKDTLMRYAITDYDNSVFLKAYNMPSYFLAVKIKNAKAEHVSFGFDYP